MDRPGPNSPVPRGERFPGFTDFAARSLTWPVILMCSGFSEHDHSSLPFAKDGRGFHYAPEAPDAANMGSAGPYASETVVRFRPDGAPKVFANVDAFHTCRKSQGDRELARDIGGTSPPVPPPAGRPERPADPLPRCRAGR